MASDESSGDLWMGAEMSDFWFGAIFGVLGTIAFMAGWRLYSIIRSYWPQ